MRSKVLKRLPLEKLMDLKIDYAFKQLFGSEKNKEITDDTLHTAFQSWETLSSTKEEILAYEARLKHVLDEEAAIREAELREMEARREGVKEGIKEGLQRTAKRMLQEGFDVETVVRLSGLSKEEVDKIKEENS